MSTSQVDQHGFMVISRSVLFRMNKKDQCTYNVILICFRATTVTVEEKISITYCESVFVALGTQPEMRMRYIVRYSA